MDVAVAEAQIRKYLSERYDVSYHPEPPGGLYLMRPDDKLYFSVVSHDDHRIGATRFVSVNRNTGVVLEEGWAGE